jgi:hypothetical protein
MSILLINFEIFYIFSFIKCFSLCIFFSLFDLKYCMLYRAQYMSHKWKSLITSAAHSE